MNGAQPMGLVSDEGAPVPLEAVRVDAVLSGPSLEVTVTQRYRNRESVPIEALYVFPLDAGAAVSGFTARIGDQLLRGRVEARDEAFAAYDDAMLAGDGAFLLDQERPNIFTASLGNLRPGQIVELELRYVALAQHEGSAARVLIPTTVSPRYVPEGLPEVGQPDAERINPEHRQAVPYGLELSVQIEGPGIARVESPSHPVRTTLTAGGARVELSQRDVPLDRDFVLLVESTSPRRPFGRVAREPDGRRVAMVSFLPALADDPEQGYEVSFLLDCSGSMEGSSIDEAKRALMLCVRALSTRDSFNVTCFGSTHHSLWPSARRFDQAALDEATRHIEGLEADLGGTELLAALRSLLPPRCDSDRPRRVLLLTDGQVGDEDEVFALAREHAPRVRIFSFGIGAGVSEHLVRGVARVSRGAAEMIGPGERIEPKVLRTFDRVRTRPVEDVHIEWGDLRVEQAPAELPPVFAGDALTVFARVDSGSAREVTLCAGQERFTVELDLEHAQNGGPIPVLWARERIRELEDRTRRRGSGHRQERGDAELLELSTRYGLVSSVASMVAIEERSEGDKTTTPAEQRRVPVALTHGWGQGRVPAARPRMIASALSMQASGFAPRALGSLAASAGAVAASAGAERSRGFFGELRRAIGAGPGGAAAPPSQAPVPRRGSVRRPAASAHDDRVFELLLTQRADGSFPRSPVLECWLGEEAVARMQAAIARHGEGAVITAVAVALLERDASERRAEWSPAMRKARGYLASCAGGFDAAGVV